MRPCAAEPGRPGPTAMTPDDLERPFPALPTLPMLAPANGAAADDSVLDLSVRSSSISDGASPPNGAHSGIGLSLADNFATPLLSAPAQHGVPIFHMRQNDSPPSVQLQGLLESNNNHAKVSRASQQMAAVPSSQPYPSLPQPDGLFSLIDPKKKIDEAAKIFTGRYAKRRPQKKTHLAPPTLNPFLKMTPSTPVEAPIQMDLDSVRTAWP